jgi:hypothetical protein
MKGWHRDNYRHSLAARGYAVRQSKLAEYRIPQYKPDIAVKKIRDYGLVVDIEDHFGLPLEEIPDYEVREYLDDKESKKEREEYRFAVRDDLNGYLQENLQSKNTDYDGLTAFWRGTSHTLFRPMDDLDADWISYNHAAGRDVQSSDNPAERAMERGAAEVGRVLTLANVEPLLDSEKDRNFRDSMIDLEFGRRTD